MAAKIKDPDSIVDFGMDWSTYLVPGDTITTSLWFVADPADDNPPNPAYLTINSSSHVDTATTVWLSKGVLAVTYSLTNRVTTVGGRTDDQTMKIKIQEK